MRPGASSGDTPPVLNAPRYRDAVTELSARLNVIQVDEAGRAGARYRDRHAFEYALRLAEIALLGSRAPRPPRDRRCARGAE